MVQPSIPTGLSRRTRREYATLAAMTEMFCRDLHGGGDSLCSECSGLVEFARMRLERCPYQADKPTCAKCPIHCYQPGRRAQIKAVMRYSGPRIALRHPIFALRHWLDGFRRVPPLRLGAQRA